MTPAALAAGWTLLVLAWIFGNPPFLAPDEPAHYVRAVSVGHASLGPAHVVEVPARLWAEWRAPGGITCNAGRRDVSAACTLDVAPLDEPASIPTAAGAYPPVFYVLPGIALRAGDDPFSAARLGRLAAAVPALALLALALAVLASPAATPLSLLGVVAAVTPMVLFVASTVNSSGLETSAGIAFLAALLRLTRVAAPPAWVWAAAAVSGLLLATSRTTGALWLVLHVAVVVGLVGVRPALARIRFAPAASAALGAALVVGVLANRAWEHVYGTAVTQTGIVPGGGAAGPEGPGSAVAAVYELPRIFYEYIGVFGWLDTQMPFLAYLPWQAVVAGAIVLAVVTGTARDRLVLAATIAVSLLVVAALSVALVATGTGDVQGRHVLPFAVAVPLLAGEIVFRNRERLEGLALRPLILLGGAVVGGTHLVGWYSNAIRQSVGTDASPNILAAPEWSPPLGWPPWLLAAVAGATLVAAAALVRPAPRS
jgi:hypothetical protein